jgi:23S rRNA (uracil1939-C5)-methyltransferase
MSRPRKKPLPTDLVRAQIEKLSHDGRGITHLNGKTVFIFGGLPGETVLFRYLSQKSRFDEGIVMEVLQASPERVTPRCPHFGTCGGCSLQHLAAAAQIDLKQATLLEQFQHLGKVQPEQVMPLLSGPVWGYRRKARLGVKYVTKKQTVLVGFREQHSSWLAELTRCEVLHPSVGERILALRDLIAQLEARDQIAQLEVAVDDTHTAFIFRNLIPLNDRDRQLLCEFAQTNDCFCYLQPAGPNSITPLWPADLALSSLEYHLPLDNLSIRFAPQDFTQVNADINHQMVLQALAWLDPQSHETVLDLFCGLGNFTLPLACRAAQVIGIEGETTLVARAEANAHRQGIDNITYYIANLADPKLQPPWLQQPYDKVLLDPPRSGALEIIQALPFNKTQRVVYVSCNPATLARDAGELVHNKGFRLVQAGVMDMFPQTTHVETMALFER